MAPKEWAVTCADAKGACPDLGIAASNYRVDGDPALAVRDSWERKKDICRWLVQQVSLWWRDFISIASLLARGV